MSSTLHLILTILQVLCAVALVAIVTLQSGKSSGLGSAVSGSAETFLSRNKGASLDAKLSRATKWVAGAFILLTLVLNLF